MDMNEKLENEIEYVESEIDGVRERLIAHMKSLMTSLEMEIKHLKENEEYSPNSLGVVQSSANTIDTYCTQLYAKRQHLKSLKRIMPKR